MEPQQEQIAPEIIQALIAKASESGLSINDYLARLLGLENGHGEQAPLEMTPDEKAQAFENWVSQHSVSGVIADDSRESIYD